ncbi:5-hydroxytryptamine receptor 3E-like [Mantella aurantiaca]
MAEYVLERCHEVLLWILSYVVHSEGCSYNDVNLKYPEASVRPVKNWTTPTQVILTYSLITIDRLDMSLQTITLIGNLLMQWPNEFISWNPDLYCGIEELYISRNKLWQPDLYIYELIENDDKSQKYTHLVVSYMGMITDVRSIRTVASCKLNMYKFPFDTQVCTLTFSSYIYTATFGDPKKRDGSSEKSMLGNLGMGQRDIGPGDMAGPGISLILGSIFSVREELLGPTTRKTLPQSHRVADIEMTHGTYTEVIENTFLAKGDWIVLEVTVLNSKLSAGGNYSRVIYSFTIKRVSEIYVLTFIMPVYFMIILDMISMFIQMDKADRLGFKITLVLGFSMLLLILNDILPLSENPPLLGIFCCVCMATMLCSIVGSIGTAYILNLYKTQENVPRWVKTILRNRLSYLLCFKRTLVLEMKSVEAQDNSACCKKGKINFELAERNEDNVGQLDIPTEVKLLKRLLLAILKIHKSLIDSKKKNVAKLQCSMAANMVDRIILIVYSLIILVLSIYVIVVWTSEAV